MNRSNLAEMEDLFYDLSSFAVDDPALEGMGLVDTIKLVKPNILIGKFLINAKTVVHFMSYLFISDKYFRSAVQQMILFKFQN